MKKTLCIILVLMLAFCADAQIAVNGSFSALVAKDGSTIIPPHAYSAISSVTEELFSVKNAENGKYALMNAKGELLTESAYTLFQKTEGGILFEKDGKYGVMDETAAVIVPNEYTWLISNGQGGYLALRTDVWDNAPDGVYLIDETGYVSPTGVKVASFLMDFTEGLSPALSTENGRYGYLNSEGQWAIRPQYAYADSFENDVAVASLDSGSGVIGKNGNWLITPKYDFVDIGEGENACVICVQYETGVTVFSADGLEKQYALSGDTYGAYVSFSGNTVVAYLSDRVVEFDREGKERLSISSDGYLFPASGGYTIAYENGEASLIGPDGEKALWGYEALDELCARGEKTYYTYVLKGDMRMGVVDSEGNTVLKADYTHITMPKEGYLLSENEGGMYLTDLDGKMIWKYEY